MRRLQQPVGFQIGAFDKCALTWKGLPVCYAAQMKTTQMCPFRIAPAQRTGGMTMDGYWVWCGSVVRDEAAGGDGRYHLFGSRWKKPLSFSPHWLTNSEIFRASSDAPEGPYAFNEVVLPPRERRYFDGLVTHNPRIAFFDGCYYLYYFGVTYDFDVPTPKMPLDRRDPDHDRIYRSTWENKRIGLATSRSIAGPWARTDRPLLDPRPDKWDRMITTNPSVAVREDGFTAMIYKSRRSWGDPLQLGFATAPHPSGPFTPLADEPTFPVHCEDPFLWWQTDRYHVIFKDFSGELCGVPFGGAYASSEDLKTWQFGGRDALAYSRTIKWTDGTSTTHGSLERPALLIQQGRPTHFVASGSIDERKAWDTSDTKIFILPVEDVVR